jgi:putative ATP-dependent endonuclease of the OLD family
MELVDFSVRNYRSITKAYRLQIRQSTILIAPNNEGKSTISRSLVMSLEFVSRLGGIENPTRMSPVLREILRVL